MKSNQTCLRAKNRLNLKVFVLPYYMHLTLSCKAYLQTCKSEGVNLSLISVKSEV